MIRFTVNLRQHQRGVTLAELTAVTLALAVAASAAVMNSASVDEARVDAAAAGVAQALRFARDESVRTVEPHGVEIDVAANRVRVFRVDTGISPQAAMFDVRDPLSRNLYVLDLTSDPALAGVALAHAPSWRATCNAPGNLVFRSASTPACLDTPGALLDAATVTLTRGSAQRSVTLEGFVARVWLQ